MENKKVMDAEVTKEEEVTEEVQASKKVKIKKIVKVVGIVLCTVVVGCVIGNITKDKSDKTEEEPSDGSVNSNFEAETFTEPSEEIPGQN